MARFLWHGAKLARHACRKLDLLQFCNFQRNYLDERLPSELWWTLGKGKLEAIFSSTSPNLCLFSKDSYFDFIFF
jgi:hypothetical protein